MGYFAILDDGTAATAGTLPNVARCHINLWSLPGILPGRRLFYFDVGVEVVAARHEVRAVQMLLPFRVEQGKWPDGTSAVQDLYESVVHQDTAELIFGGPVAHSSTGNYAVLKVGDYDQPLRVIRVKPGSVAAVDGYETRQDSSLYTVELATPIPPGESAYFRIRWRVFGAFPLWQWKRFSGGARVDLRICDVRESRFVDLERHLRDRILGIAHANVFLMASPKLHVAGRSPEFKYLRILEPGAWKRYLGGAHHVGSVRGLLVYYWAKRTSSQQGEAGVQRLIDADNPYRIFVDFNRASATSWWMQILRVVIGTVLAVLLIKGAAAADSWSGDWLSSLATDGWTVVKILVGGALVGWLATWEKLRRFAAARFMRPRAAVRGAERFFLGWVSRS